MMPLIVLFLSLLALSCQGPAANAGGFNSPNPGAKLYAITQAGNRKDRRAIPHLIQQLQSDDMAVRMYAIGALERIASTRLGYEYYASPSERQAAVERWLAAYNSGRFDDASTRHAEPSSRNES